MYLLGTSVKIFTGGLKPVSERPAPCAKRWHDVSEYAIWLQHVITHNILLSLVYLLIQKSNIKHIEHAAAPFFLKNGEK